MKNRTFYIRRASLSILIGLAILSTTGFAQENLAEDQNPNYRKSMEKYMAVKSDYIKNEGQTVQKTYKAIDDMQIKEEKKALRKENRQERRMARINNNNVYYSYNPYQYDYLPTYGLGYGYHYATNYYRPYNNYRPYHYSNNYYRPYSYRSCNLGNAALLGLGAYLLLR